MQRIASPEYELIGSEGQWDWGLSTGGYDFALGEESEQFFNNLFSNASYPTGPVYGDSITRFAPFQDSSSALPSVPSYKSESEVIEAYYLWIHPTFPILPPPRYQISFDPSIFRATSDIRDYFTTFEPSSPLILAILAHVVLVPTQHEEGPMEHEIRQQLSRSIALCARESVEVDLAVHSRNQGSEGLLQTSFAVRSTVHPDIPVELESIIALSLLANFEYLQNGNINAMKECADMALGLAMNSSLHQKHISCDTFSEARSRAWWMTLMCACNASIPMDIPPNDPRFTADFPSICGSSSSWISFIKAEKMLYSATMFLVYLLTDNGHQSQIPYVKEGMKVLHNTIEEEIFKVQGTEDENHEGYIVDQSERIVDLSLIKLARLRLNSAMIKTHRYCAFVGTTTPVHGISASTSPSSISTPDVDSQISGSPDSTVFSFSADESFQICLRSSLTNAKILRSLPSQRRVEHSNGSTRNWRTQAPFACSLMQCGYTLLMIIHKTSLRSPISQRHDNSQLRLFPECKAALEVVLATLKDYGMLWQAVHGMHIQMQEAVQIYFGQSQSD